MVNQTEKAIDIFNKDFRTNIAVFAFDNPNRHACKANDELVANGMNLWPGGKQLVIHSTQWGDGSEQSMVFLDGDENWNTGHGIRGRKA